MIISGICYALLYRYSPWDGMLCNLPRIDSIRCIVVIILINDNDAFWFSSACEIYFEENSNMLSIRECERIIWFTIKTRDHHPLILREYFCIRSIGKIDKWSSWFPFLRWSISPVRYCFRKCHTLSDISSLRELWEKLISAIAYRTWIRRVCH